MIQVKSHTMKLVYNHIINPEYVGKKFGCGIPMSLGTCDKGSVYVSVYISYGVFDILDVNFLEFKIRRLYPSALIDHCSGKITVIIKLEGDSWTEVDLFGIKPKSLEVYTSIFNLQHKTKQMITLAEIKEMRENGFYLPNDRLDWEDMIKLMSILDYGLEIIEAAYLMPMSTDSVYYLKHNGFNCNESLYNWNEIMKLAVEYSHELTTD